MADQKPPRLHGDERATLLSLLQYQRESFVRKIDGVDEAAARRPLVASGTTLLWLAVHMARAEVVWVQVRFAGREVEPRDDTLVPGDSGRVGDPDVPNDVGDHGRVIAGAALDDLCQRVDDEAPVDLRWVITHLLEETARHAGHADILRELVDGSTGR